MDFSTKYVFVDLFFLSK